MPSLSRLLFTLIFAAGLMVTLRLGAVWHEAGVAFAQTAPAHPEAGTPITTPSRPATPSPSGDPAKNQQKFSPEEVELLQDLSKRRTELDARAEEFDRRELLLKAAEQRVQE